MGKRMSMIFHTRKSKATKENLVPIYLRVTIDGKRCEPTTKQLISEERSEIVDGIDGGKWLLIKRQQTRQERTVQNTENTLPN